MLALVATLVLGVTPTDKLAPYRDQPVLSVDIEAPGEESIAGMQALIGIEPGHLLSPTALQSAVKRLFALGRFENVEVYARRLSGSVQLSFYLPPLRRLRDLTVEGLGPIEEEPFLTALQAPPGTEVDRRFPLRLRERAQNHLRSEGYPHATLGISVQDGTNAGTLDHHLEVRPGLPVTVRRVRFEGPVRVSPSILEGLVRTGPGTPVSLRRLSRDQKALESAFLQRGFRRVQVATPQCQRGETPPQPCDTLLQRIADAETPPAPAVDVIFRIEAGPRIALHFLGNTVVSTDYVSRLWPETTARIGPGSLALFVERIERAYTRLGYIGTEVHMRGFRDLERGLERYVFKIQEAPPTRVRRITFPGADAIAPKLLRQQLEARLSAELDELSALSLEPLTPGQTDLVQLKQREYGASRLPHRFISSVPPAQRWVPGIFEAGVQELTSIYRDQGYLDAVLTLEPRINGRWMDVVVQVQEGVQTRIDSVAFRNAPSVEAPALLAQLETMPVAPGGARVMPGAPLSQSAVEEGRIALLRYYRDQGFLYSRVFIRVTLSADRSRCEVEYRVEEGPQVRIDNVIIRGNIYTRTSILRSRMTLAPGDVYRVSQAVQDQRALARLGVFSSVRVKLLDEERPAERKDVVAEVVERNRQPVELEFGVSTADGPRLRVNYSHLNLFGTATTFAASAKLNRQVFFGLYGEFAETLRARYREFDGGEQLTKALEHQIRLGFISPQLLFLPFDPALRLALVLERENTLRYSLQELALVLGADLFLGDRITLSLESRASLTSLECPALEGGLGGVEIDDDAPPGCSEVAQAQRRQQEIVDGRRFEVGPRLTFDFRDSPFKPTRGFLARANVSYVLGDGFAFPKFEAALTGYFKLFHPVLAVSARGGLIPVTPDSNNLVPLDQRFDLGGRDTLRGFVERSLIPQDVCLVAANKPLPNPVPRRCSAVTRVAEGQPPVPTGGTTYLVLKAELRIPLGTDLSLGLFVDAGNLWLERPNRNSLTLRVGLGAGLRVATPVGALVFDLGFNPAPRDLAGETTGPQPHFSVGVF